jgi:hypothetical protein
MKRTIIAIAAALALPTAALAEDTAPTTKDSANAACKAEKAAMGAATFKATYGGKANAFGKCVSARTKTINAAKSNAAKDCRAEQAADSAAFTTKYGTGKNGKNAFGKCVSSKAKAQTAEDTKARVNAAKTCKAAKKADSAAFATQWGTGKNAFGKCVSATAKAKNDDTTETTTS